MNRKTRTREEVSCQPRKAFWRHCEQHSYPQPGEATRQLPEDFIAQFPNVPWRQMASLRNRLVHDYFGVDLVEIICQVVCHDLTQLRAQLENFA